MDRSVYITSTGAFLPGKPVTNEEMEQYIGKINDRRSRLGRFVLRQNGIKTRHYALTPDGVHLHSGADMAVRAIRDALSRSEIAAERLSFLAAATTQATSSSPVSPARSMANSACGPWRSRAFRASVPAA
ncbi:hypothetical protein ACMHYB_30570 [Sorangium sp. So ce1128]